MIELCSTGVNVLEEVVVAAELEGLLVAAVVASVELPGPAVIEENGAANVKTSLLFLQHDPGVLPPSQHTWMPPAEPL